MQSTILWIIVVGCCLIITVSSVTRRGSEHALRMFGQPWKDAMHNYRGHSHNDVVDGYMDELDKEPNEAHDRKANCCCKSNLLKFCGNNRNIYIPDI